MRLTIESELSFRSAEAMDFLLQIEVAQTAQQDIASASLSLSPEAEFTRIAAQENIGRRLWVNVDGELRAEYKARVSITRENSALDALTEVDVAHLPSQVVPYLFDTRYCQTDKFAPFADEEFEGLTGGSRVAAMLNWIAEHFSYDPMASNAETTALDTFMARRGVCRDYAHVLISLVRASGIPARYVACYAPDVTPQDFHAVVEVFLSEPEGRTAGWHLVDATGMSEPGSTAIIGVGRDAADVSFLTSFGTSEFLSCAVSVSRDE